MNNIFISKLFKLRLLTKSIISYVINIVDKISLTQILNFKKQ